MSEIASASLNTFGHSPKADFVPPSEQLITLSYGQLQDLIINAVQMAVQPVQDEISQLQATSSRPGRGNSRLAHQAGRRGVPAGVRDIPGLCGHRPGPQEACISGASHQGAGKDCGLQGGKDREISIIAARS